MGADDLTLLEPALERLPPNVLPDTLRSDLTGAVRCDEKLALRWLLKSASRRTWGATCADLVVD